LLNDINVSQCRVRFFFFSLLLAFFSSLPLVIRYSKFFLKEPVAIAVLPLRHLKTASQYCGSTAFKIWAQFHQCSMYSFYVRKSQKRKKILTTQLYFLRFWDLRA